MSIFEDINLAICELCLEELGLNEVWSHHEKYHKHEEHGEEDYTNRK